MTQCLLLLVNKCAGTALTSWQHEVHILCSMPRVQPMQQGEPHPSACTAVQMRQTARQAARATCRDHLKIIPPTRLLPRGPRSTSGWPWLHAHALRSPLCSAKAAELDGTPGELPIVEFCPLLPDRSLSVYDDHYMLLTDCLSSPSIGHSHDTSAVQFAMTNGQNAPWFAKLQAQALRSEVATTATPL